MSLEIIETSENNNENCINNLNEGKIAALLNAYYDDNVMASIEPPIATKVSQAVCEWMDSLDEKSAIDVFHQSYQAWYEAKILWRNGPTCKVHYLHWNDKFDEVLDLANKPLIYPRNTYTVPKTKKQKMNDTVTQTARAISPTNSHDINAIIITTKSGRKSAQKPQENVIQRKKRATSVRVSDDLVPDKNEWICGLCDQLEAFDDSNLILCDGPCRRSFHTGCLGLIEENIPENSWLCEECTVGRHACFMCGESGIDNIDLRKCSISACGKHYHYRCLATSDAPYAITSNRDQANADDDATGFRFRCPYHFCDVCYSAYGAKDSRSTLHRCFKCPRAYHVNCIPPGTRFNALALLCPDHPSDALPSRELADRCMPCGSLNNIWDQMTLPESLPCSEKIFNTSFVLPISIKEDVASQPPSFKLIWKLDYDRLSKEDGLTGEKMLPYHVPNETCECTERCGDDCLNRLLNFECWDPPSGTLCAIGGDCGNRQFVNREYVKVKPFQEHKMGWGLKTLEFVAKGRLVIEYIGEVIAEREMQERMIRQRDETPHDHDFYIMELDNGYFVDGKFKGNLSRFINHSCDPNCELQRWVVRGRTRIGIIAIRNIAENEPLSYDYQFDTREEDTFKCYCGAKNCRGTMAPRRKIDKAALTKAEKVKFIQVGKLRDKKTDDSRNTSEWKRSYTGKYAPGDGLVEIKLGPLSTTFEDARSMHLFLPRNAKYGANFMRRRKRSKVDNL